MTNPMPPDPTNTFASLMIPMHEAFVAAIDAGFTVDQAMALVLKCMELSALTATMRQIGGLEDE